MPLKPGSIFAAVLALLTSTAPSADEQDENAGLVRLNGLRSAAGLTPLSMNGQLRSAARNHSGYSAINNVTGHYENPNDNGFTGIQPSDRTTYSGYQSTVITENVSHGQSSTAQSVDSLMSAIYHRFAFLQLDIDEIGIGAYGTFFTYDMANSALNGLCNGASFNGPGSYYLGVCADANFKIEKSRFDEANALLAFSNPNMTLWPYENARDVPPAFFEESPDPLPDHSVSGYPVSVEFNEARIHGSITVQNFALFDQSGTEITNVRRFLSPSDDVNGKFSDKQFALFPLQRLDWGKTYRVRFDYTVGNETPQTRIWWFTTRGLPHPYYQVNEPAAAAFNVRSNQAYSVYVIPQHENDTLSSYSYSYSGGMTVDAELFDANTINVAVSGSPGQQVRFTFNNGQQLRLTVAATDTAIDNTVVYDRDNDGITDGTDNCPDTSNSAQTDTEGDGSGDACDADDDNDGLTDIDETTTHHTNPLQRDSDGDGMDDGYEVENDLDPTVDDANGDRDRDGHTNLAEFIAGTAANDRNDPAPNPFLLQVIIPMLLEE